MRLKLHRCTCNSSQPRALAVEPRVVIRHLDSCFYKHLFSIQAPCLDSAIMGDPRDPSSYSVVPHLKYNTVGGVNGPLVILESVRLAPPMSTSHHES